MRRKNSRGYERRGKWWGEISIFKKGASRTLSRQERFKTLSSKYDLFDLSFNSVSPERENQSAHKIISIFLRGYATDRLTRCDIRPPHDCERDGRRFPPPGVSAI